MQRKESAAPAWKNLAGAAGSFYVVDSEMCIKKPDRICSTGRITGNPIDKSSQKNNNVITLIKQLIKDNT